MEKISRRDFLEKCGRGAMGAISLGICGSLLSVIGCERKPEEKKLTLDDYMRVIYTIESGRKPSEQRYESHINDTSYGLGQLTTETALALERRFPDLPRISDYAEFSKKEYGLIKAKQDLIKLYGERIEVKREVVVDGKKRIKREELDVRLDEKIDGATAIYIDRIQRKHRLKRIGELDEKTIEAIRKERHLQERLFVPEINQAYATRLFQLGLERYGTPELAAAAYNSGQLAPRTARAQQMLSDLFYPQWISPDGDNGKATKRIVSEFQKRAGLVEDGIIGDRTFEVMREVWAESFPNEDNPKGAIPKNQYTPGYVEKFRKMIRN